jgi:endonuclease YncB( thermonuclease family)
MERSDPESVSITKRALLSFQSVKPTAPIVSTLDGDTIEVLHNDRPAGKSLSADVLLSDGTNINHTLVKYGCAIKYAPGYDA